METRMPIRTPATLQNPVEDYRRLPGLFRGWEVPEVLEGGADLHVEDAGATEDGTPVFAVYRRATRTR